MIPGQKLGAWTCIGPCDTPKYHKPKQYVRVQCECGTIRAVAVAEIIAGNSRSCGCVNRKMRRATIKAHCIEVASGQRKRRGG
jgi:hypothetical protein